jgi:uroporphyrinogen-III decarboxylase
MDPPPKMIEFMKRLHDFYCRQLTAWAKTDVDALSFMDDWGSQRGLLISPKLWVEYFKPMYRDYIDIAHSHGKKIFMHSDGHILAIYPHLIELGLDAINSQLFCMGLDNLAQFRGKITFWGEIDRQHLLPHGSVEEIDATVKKVYETLWQDGGCIAQLEFGPGCRPENAYQAFKTWDEITGNR